jgi:hypothetical protein
VTASAGWTWYSPWAMADAAVARHPAVGAKQPSRGRQHPPPPRTAPTMTRNSSVSSTAGSAAPPPTPASYAPLPDSPHRRRASRRRTVTSRTPLGQPTPA